MLLAAAAIMAGGALLAAEPWHEPAAAAITNCSTNTADMNAAETEVLRLVNAERQRAGLTQLRPSPNLNRAAAWKSEDSSAAPPNFSHTDSLGRSPFQRVKDCGYPGSGAGENIAYGYATPEEVVQAWMASSGHRANILNRSYVVAGVGQSGVRWTLDFGTYDDSGGADLPLPTATTPAGSTGTPTATATPTRTPTATPTPTRTATPGPAAPSPQTPARTPTPTPTRTPTVPSVGAPPPPTPTLAPATPSAYRLAIPGLARD